MKIQPREFLRDEISKKLLELKFKENHSIKSKYLKFFVISISIAISINMHFSKCKKEIKKKREKTKKEGKNYCLSCRNYTGNIHQKGNNDK